MSRLSGSLIAIIKRKLLQIISAHSVWTVASSGQTLSMDIVEA
jgi:hypothetical protein